MTAAKTDDEGTLGTAGEALDDEFEGAFNEAAEVSGINAEIKIPAEESAPVVKAETQPAKAAEAKEEPVATAAIEKQPGETEEKYEQRYKTLQGIHRKDKETWDARERELLSQVEEAKKPKTEPKTEPSPGKLTDKEAADAYDSLSPEDKEVLAQYEDAFDVVSKAEGIKRKAELGRLSKRLDQIKDEIRTEMKAEISTIRGELNPVTKKLEADDLALHWEAIEAAHSDYRTYADGGEGHVDLMTWVESKPKYLQPALLNTIQKGSADEVIDLLNDYKRENNIPLTSPQTETQSNVVTMTPKKAEKKAALSTVTTRRGAVATGYQVADDFEGAFEEAVNRSGGK